MGYKHEETKDMVREAIAHLESGNVDDAILTLRSAANPKFDSFESCHYLYVKAMKAKREAS